MKPFTLLAFLTLSLSVSGCATQWSRADTTEQQLAQDLELCEESAEKDHPVSMSVSGPNYQAQNSVGCGAGGDCRARPGSQIGNPNQDLNKTARDKATMSCMELKGYRQQ
jgi:hypothetical protein